MLARRSISVSRASKGLLDIVTSDEFSVMLTRSVPLLTSTVTPLVSLLLTPSISMESSTLTPSIPLLVSPLTLSVPSLLSLLTPSISSLVPALTLSIPSLISTPSRSIPLLISGLSNSGFSLRLMSKPEEKCRELSELREELLLLFLQTGNVPHEPFLGNGFGFLSLLPILLFCCNFCA